MLTRSLNGSKMATEGEPNERGDADVTRRLQQLIVKLGDHKKLERSHNTM